MAVDRALLVDVLPASQQEVANAWGARMVQIGSIVGYWMCVNENASCCPFSLTKSSSLRVEEALICRICSLGWAVLRFRCYQRSRSYRLSFRTPLQ